MSNQSDAKSESNKRLALRRETLKNLGVRSGLKTGRAACEGKSEISCNGVGGFCTCSVTRVVNG